MVGWVKTEPSLELALIKIWRYMMSVDWRRSH
jgi:hypothetical protein